MNSSARLIRPLRMAAAGLRFPSILLNAQRAAPSSLRTISSSSPVSKGLPSDDGGDDGFVRPGPPPLPMKEQREFEKLVREKANTPQFQPAAQFKDGEKHPQYRAKPVPEFDGETNPKTGEVGGPKNDPLQWEREWSYGGRATDF